MLTDYEHYKHLLIHKPERQWQQDPSVVFEKVYNEIEPTFSIVMPIHNQNNIIQTVLSSVVANTVGLYEIIIILDGCTDGSKERVLEWISDVTLSNNVTRIAVMENTFGIFETSCDNQGFVNSRGTYIVEIQADMKIVTFGYNILLTTPMEVYSDMIGVSGRCCHTLNTIVHGLHVGKLGELVKSPHTATFTPNIVYLSHTVNRGPLALRNSMLKELGYLDEKHYVLGDDEHDLFTRAWNEKKWRTGFVPVEVYSPLEWGSTRKSMPGEVRDYLTQRMKNMSDGFMSKHRATFSYPPGETRTIELSQQIQAVNRLSKSS